MPQILLPVMHFIVRYGRFVAGDVEYGIPPFLSVRNNGTGTTVTGYVELVIKRQRKNA
jgi:hypothetical protein